jgi:hypothetical protein
MPVPSIIESQLEISWKMRKLLILWLVEVHSEYTLTQETLFLTIHILDRMASKVHISRAQYQLVGLAALWIAAKYEENHGRVPTLKNLCYMACNAFKDRELLSMERMILNHLKFDLGAPTSEAFLDAQIAMMGRRVSRQATSMAR